MHKLLSKIPIENINKLLPDSIEKSKVKSLEELTASSSLSETRKRFYKLSLDGSPDLHLSYGKGLSDAYERSKAFYSKLPDLTCKPLFLVKDGTYELFAQEFFEGIPIDESFEAGTTSDPEVTKILKTLESSFASIERSSTKEDMNKEFQQHKDSVLNNDNFEDLDREYLKLYFLPSLEENLSFKNPTTRWSSGDLAARNILVNSNNEFRLIDYEFALETHFHCEDWTRLNKFSSSKFSENQHLQNLIQKLDPFFQSYLILRQLHLNKSVHTKENFRHFASEDLAHSILSLANRSIGKPVDNPLLIKGICNANKILEGKFAEERDNRELKEQELVLERENRELKEQELVLERENRELKEQELVLERENRELKEQELVLERENRELKEQELVLEKENRELKEQELSIKTDKIRRMQSSFSWKITSPLRHLRRKFLDSKKYTETDPYSNWVKNHENQNRHDDLINGESLKHRPLISIIMPVFNTPTKYLSEAILSVLNQTYNNFELCIADDNSGQKKVKETLKKFAKTDSRIKVIYRKETGNISKATNSAISIATGEYIGFLDHDDILNSSALMSVVAALNFNKNLKLIYSDEDKINPNGIRVSPYFKPDWNFNLFLSQNYLCHFVVLDKQTFDAHGCFRSECDGAQDWDNLLHIISKIKDEQIFHIPKVLYHWRIHENSTASNVSAKSNVISSSLKALKDFSCRENFDANIKIVEEYYFHVSHKLPIPRPLVTIIIPTRNNFVILKRCIDSLVINTDYENYKIVLVNNSSDELETLEYLEALRDNDNIQIHNYDKVFNHSAINNLIVERNNSDLYLFLNDDTEMIQPDWLTTMVGSIQQKNLGIVGCKLLYPNRKVQHAGVVLGIGDFAGHAYRHLRENEPVMGARLHLKQNYTAVTAACMLIKSDVFKSVNGFNAINLPTSYNDVDLCLRVAEKNYKILYEPVTVIHHESATRGKPTTKELIIAEENAVKYMKSKWEKLYQRDPNYNSNLTRVFENFSY